MAAPTDPLRLADDLGAPVVVPAGGPRRIVSLVPSITEALALDVPDLLVGATDWCTHPAGLDVARVRGTKNPDLAAIRALAPDLVVANKEENRELDVRRLREAGVTVWVSDVRTVRGALDALDRIYLEALRLPRPAWLAQAREQWDAPPPPVRGRVVVPIWRDPWMVVGPDTYTADVLRLLGWAVTSGSADADRPGDPTAGDRYPTRPLAALDTEDADLVLLPDEPYVFTATDGPEAFTRVPTRLVSGRLLTWYGPAMVEAHAVLAASLAPPSA